MSEITISKRPTKLTEEQSLPFWKTQAVLIIKNQYHEYTDIEDAECVEDVANELKDNFSYNCDGYEFAKKIQRDSYGFKIDSELCQYLDFIIMNYASELESKVKDWVTANNITPKFKKGQKIQVTSFINSTLKKEGLFYITGVKEDRGIYYVHENSDNNGGYVLSFERIEEACIPID